MSETSKGFIANNWFKLIGHSSANKPRKRLLVSCQELLPRMSRGIGVDGLICVSSDTV